MFCSRCGLKMEEGARFCTGCGQELGASAAGTHGVAGAPVSIGTPYAGFWIRFVAYFIDGLILTIPFWLVVMVMFFLFGGFGLIPRMSGVDDPRAALALLAPVIFGFLLAWLIMIVMQWLYFAGMESSARQATFGKAVMSLRVTNLEGQRLSFGHATGRIFAKIVLGIVPFGVLTYIMAGFTEKKQALHDMIAGTLVLRK